MLLPRIMVMLAGSASLFAAAPASAQFFLKSADLPDGRVTGSEPGMIGPALADTTPAELRAALVWNLRAALNVAALQCQFEPTLLTLDNYNALLKDHEVELRQSYDALTKYFTRVNKSAKQGLTELDKFGTRVYSGFSTVSGQLSFCQTAAAISQEALFTPRGQLGDLAQRRMRELRASLAAWGDQFRYGYRFTLPQAPAMPPFANDRCWRKGTYQVRRCGNYQVASNN